MNSFLHLISNLLGLYIWVLIFTAIFSWLIAFEVLNVHSSAVRSIWRALWGLTEPVLRPVRRVLPDLGGVDISPVIVILVIIFARDLMLEWLSV